MWNYDHLVLLRWRLIHRAGGWCCVKVGEGALIYIETGFTAHFFEDIHSV